MIINITGKQMEITPAIRQHAEERLAKLAKWQTQLINPHIILSKQPQDFVADATLSTPNGQLVASATHQDMYLAINELLAKLERQINKVQHKGEARCGMCQDREFYGGIAPLAGGSTRERQRYPLDSAPSRRVLY